MTDKINVGIAGLGNVGACVLKLLLERSNEIAVKSGTKIVVKAVSARDKEKNRGVDLNDIDWYQNPMDMLEDSSIDIVVELMGGSHGIAFDFVQNAIKKNKKLVTANKALLAERAKEIDELLKGYPDANIACEASVGGGIPCIKTLREGLAANDVTSVYGILNGTCNFILSEMTETGRSFSEVLAEAQKLGYAEADPSFDIDGNDAGHKIALLAAFAFGGLPDFKNVMLKGIRNITAEDIVSAKRQGSVLKLIAKAEKTSNGIKQSVEPVLISEDDVIAKVNGCLNMVCFETGHAGKVTMIGAGAGGNATASAVVSDIIDIAKGRKETLFT